MCKDGNPSVPYFIKGSIIPKPINYKTLIIKWKKETQEVNIDKDGNYLFNMADFDGWDIESINQPFTISFKKEEKLA